MWQLALGQIAGRAALDAPSGAPSSVIQSIQQGTITIAAGTLSNTATISSVNTANSILIWDGTKTDTPSPTTTQRWITRIALTNGTTVTATREASSGTVVVTVGFTVIEFASGVNSIQSGTIAMTAAETSQTATISAVGANAFVLLLGATTAVTGLNWVSTQGSVVLTNSTTVTANCILTSALTVGYMVVDLDSTIVSAVRPGSVTDASANASYTGTITSVDTTRSALFYNGLIGALVSSTVATAGITHELTNGTTVTLTRSNTTTTSRTSYYTVVEFQAAVIQSVQRGTIVQAAATSNTATVSSVNTAKAFVNWGSLRAASANADTVASMLALTDATTVTASTLAAGSPTTAYEVVEFV